MDFGIRRDPPCSDCDPSDGHCTMNCGPAAPTQALLTKDAILASSLRASLERMTQAFRPFMLRPIGGEGSQVRMEQDEQIAAHAEAVKLLGR